MAGHLEHGHLGDRSDSLPVFVGLQQRGYVAIKENSHVVHFTGNIMALDPGGHNTGMESILRYYDRWLGMDTDYSRIPAEVSVVDVQNAGCKLEDINGGW